MPNWLFFSLVFLIVAADYRSISPIMFLLAAIIVSVGHREFKMSVLAAASWTALYLLTATAIGVVYAAL